MFCGECGRAVVPEPALLQAAQGPTAVIDPVPAVAFSSAGDSSEDPADHVVAAPVQATCPQCGAAIDGGEVFCGECGFVLRSALIEPPAPAAADDRADDDRADDDRAVPERAADDPADLVPALPADLADSVDPRPARPDPFPWGLDPENDRRPSRPASLASLPDAEDIETTRLVSEPLSSERFVLQFSTGENVTVSGAGLIGRNPVAQPGEYVDQLVAIFDASKSVSKTHLEFGQDGGRFWVSDRYSTNGSVVRQPDADPRRCEPGRRYFVARGTRIDVGEQFFVVS